MGKNCKVSDSDVLATYKKFLKELREDNRPCIGDKPKSDSILRKEAFLMTADVYDEIYVRDEIRDIIRMCAE